MNQKTFPGLNSATRKVSCRLEKFPDVQNSFLVSQKSFPIHEVRFLVGKNRFQTVRKGFQVAKDCCQVFGDCFQVDETWFLTIRSNQKRFPIFVACFPSNRNRSWIFRTSIPSGRKDPRCPENVIFTQQSNQYLPETWFPPNKVISIYLTSSE